MWPVASVKARAALERSIFLLSLFFLSLFLLRNRECKFRDSPLAAICDDRKRVIGGFFFFFLFSRFPARLDL